MKQSLINVFLAVLIAFGMFTSYVYLERAFQRGDIRRSIEAVQKARAEANGPTILEGLLQKYGPSAEIHWTARMEDTVKGIVLVAAQLPDKTILRWRVNVLSGTVKLMEEKPVKP